MKFCPECGTERLPQAKFCHNCSYNYNNFQLDNTKSYTTEEVLQDPRFRYMAEKFNMWEGLQGGKAFLLMPYTIYKTFKDPTYTLENERRKWITKYIDELSYPVGNPLNSNLSAFKEKLRDLNENDNEFLVEMLLQAISNKEFAKTIAIEGTKFALNPKKGAVDILDKLKK